MFTKSKLTKFTNEIISIEELHEMTIQPNPSINLLRTFKKEDNRYSPLKNSLPCILPHGIFSALKNDSLIRLSGYLYFDIDNLELDELNKIKASLITNMKPTFLCVSCGGRGLSMLFKVPGISVDNFNYCYNFIYSILVNQGYNIDKGAGGLSRKWIISQDTTCYLNTSNCFNIDLNIFNKNLRGSFGIKTIEEKEYLLSEPLKKNKKTKIDIIPLNILLQDINIKTIYDKEIIGNYNIDEVDGYVNIFLIKDLKDGMKRKTYTRIILQLIYLNEYITLEEIFSFLYWYNNYLNTKRMMVYELEKLVKYIYKENIDKPKEELNIKTRTKKIFFSPDSFLTTSDKQSIGAKVSGILRSNKTKDRIIDSIIQLEKDNIKVTKENIHKISGLSIATIKRNWKKEKKDPNQFK